jgi:hypothetical protein
LADHRSFRDTDVEIGRRHPFPSKGREDPSRDGKLESEVFAGPEPDLEAIPEDRRHSRFLTDFYVPDAVPERRVCRSHLGESSNRASRFGRMKHGPHLRLHGSFDPHNRQRAP